MALVPPDVTTAVHSLEAAPAAPIREQHPPLEARYRRVRAFSQELCEPLAVEDYVVQSMPDASPVKWHLMHTSWFFETFVLKEALPQYQPFDPEYAYLFNSYYNAVGPQFPRPRRGNLSRPTVAEVQEYRRHVDQHVLGLLHDLPPSLAEIVELGIQHEQQHQELMLTDFKHVLCSNPLQPVYRAARNEKAGSAGPLRWLEVEEAIREIGHDGQGFAYDNELPRHRQLVQRFRMATRLSTNGEYLAFMESGGYEQPQWWLSEGWQTVQAEGWRAPLYWVPAEDGWKQSTLHGLQALKPEEPVCHLSYYEADAFARWSGARLPTEFEWETVAARERVRGNFVEARRFHPAPPPDALTTEFVQLYGDVWEWTGSAYLPYPGYAPPAGALGEYNGKFMCNQMVLRGGSCATSITHIRKSYRNFFPPAARWQFSGVRLARSM